MLYILYIYIDVEEVNRRDQFASWSFWHALLDCMLLEYFMWNPRARSRLLASWDEGYETAWRKVVGSKAAQSLVTTKGYYGKANHPQIYINLP